MSGSLDATVPPAGLPGLDPSWSRLVTARDSDGVPRTWHVLDSHAAGDATEPRLTLLCVHGNPTWSYLWRNVVRQAPADVRVVAVDQLDMGYSERTTTVRRLAQRIDDLDAVAAALGIDGPVVTVAHDWGGPISLGWALRHRDRLRGVVLLNTAVHQPAGSPAPSIIRLARSRPLLAMNTVQTPAFVRGTTALSGRRMPKEIAAAFAAPYGSPERREAVGAFVGDIPLEVDHPSAATLDEIAEGVRSLDVPVLLLWGPGDPVFSDLYLNDLIARIPHADVHRYEGARHLVSEDAPSLVADLLTWVADLDASSDVAGTASSVPAAGDDASVRLWSDLERRAAQTPDAVAIAEPTQAGWRRVSWGLLARNVDLLARGLSARGIRAGDRVSVLVPPSADLVAVVYACWRIGASVVVTDTGLGARGIRRALRGAAPDHVIAIPRGMALVRAIRLPARRIPVADLPAIARLGASQPPLTREPDPQAEAVVAFTSGSTGPAKGVVYRHHQVQRTRDVLRAHYGITDNDALVAAFAPWAVLGPALGIASAIPDMDVTRPSSLTARALASATAVVRGTLIWASPAALAAVLDTAPELSDADLAALQSLRLVMGAGAPVSSALLHGMARLCPGADIRTPYGMTEVLPVTDVTVAEIDAAGRGDGVLVGSPLPGVDVRISALDDEGRAVGPLSAEPGVLGEVVVRAAHQKDHYDRLWATERASSRDRGWHRTGDVGSLDEHGRLWLGGRLAHVVTTADGPVAPVAVEQAAQELADVSLAACVGVGPRGTQQVVVIVRDESGRDRLASLDLSARVRTAVAEGTGTRVDVAAVLSRGELPVDIRHRSKIDRTALAAWADEVLAGRR